MSELNLKYSKERVITLDYMKDVLLTWNDEKMYVETIFREIGNGEEYLYWYSVQGEDGKHIEDHSMRVIGNIWDFGSIDEEEPSVDMKTEEVMILENIQAAMK